MRRLKHYENASYSSGFHILRKGKAMDSLQSVCRDNQLLIAEYLAQEPSKVTAWVPSVRSWGTTNIYFRALLLEAGWLAPADVCKAKFAQAVRFTCPALRVLDLAEHFAPVLPMPALSATLATLPKTPACPNPSALPLMLVTRAGARLRPATKAELVKSVAQSTYALPVDEGTQRWNFSKPERQALKRFIADCIGVFDGGDFNVLLANGERYFAEDCMDVALNLPVGLKALALHELSYCIEELSNLPLEGVDLAKVDILFDMAGLVPQQWNSALVDHTCFPMRSLDQCLRVVLAHASTRTTRDICQRALKLMCHFLDGLPKENRHWTRLEVACSTDELRLIQGLVRLLHDHLHIPGVKSLYVKAAVRHGLLTQADVKSSRVLEKFNQWCKLENSAEGILKAYLWQQLQRLSDS